MTYLTPKAPDAAWLKPFVLPSLIDQAPYKIDTPNVKIKLDQNESPWDLPPRIKAQVLERVAAMAWNRYPSAFADQLAAKVAAYAGVAPSAVLLGPGSNYLVSLVLSVFSKGIQQGDGKLVIARPSFPLYESHCRYEGIPYEIWNLNADLDFDLALMPELSAHSVVIFASPNNPVGNVLPKAALQTLLTRHPSSLFIADEAYFEYAAEPYTDLLANHANLLLLRTFSKTLGAAGVRLGYALGSEACLGLLKKLRLPYLLNHFSIACADVILSDESMREHLTMIRDNAVSQRTRVREELVKDANGAFQVKESQANFLLLRWPTQEAAQKAYRRLIEQDILVRDVSGAPGLKGCLRATLGNDRENDALVQAFRCI